MSIKQQRKMSDSFWWLFGFDALIALIVLYFFFVGIADGSVSSFNSGIWTILLLVAIGIPAFSLFLRHTNHIAIAKTLLWVMATPGILYGIFILLMIILKPKWN